MTLVGWGITATLALMVALRSRSGAAASAIAGVCYLTEGQSVDIAGFRMTAIRILLAVAICRVVSRGELTRVRFNPVDRIVVLYSLSLLLVATIRVGTVQELTYRIGMFGNALSAYFVFAALLETRQDFENVIAETGVLIVPFALLMCWESITGKNVFAALGGVYANSWIRDGHVRSAGAFRNPITAGAFGATFCLLFSTVVFAMKRGKAIWVGLLSSVLIVISSRSSGPVLGLVIGCVAFVMWPLRRHTRTLRWSLVATIGGLALVMKAPVWFLIDRVSDITGGGGYHRAFLIDRFVNSFQSWWLLGTSDTRNWFPYTLPDGTTDMTNRFVLDGVDAGVLGLILSLAVISLCFSRVGKAMNAAGVRDPQGAKTAWGLGSVPVANVGILVSVTYFDQMFVIWYFLLACIGRLDIGLPTTRVGEMRAATVIPLKVGIRRSNLAGSHQVHGKRPVR